MSRDGCVQWIAARSKTFWWAMGLATCCGIIIAMPAASNGHHWSFIEGIAAGGVTIACAYGITALAGGLKSAIIAVLPAHSPPFLPPVPSPSPPPTVAVSGALLTVTEQFSIEQLHPAVREAARTFWMHGHYRQAVDESALNINAMLQQKLGIWTATTHSMIEQAFSTEAARPGVRRLRPPGDRNTPTYSNRLEGMKLLGTGCFKGIRNVSAHEQSVGWDRVYSFHLITTLSLFAMWVDECVVDH